MTAPQYNDKVFINCPFDDQYAPLLHAIVYAIYSAGFFPVSALSYDNALQNRLSKIEDCIENCRYGVHDISRTQLNDEDLPRFNMPFELGIFFGAKKFGNKNQKSKNGLVFDHERFRYQKFISDLNGIDIKAHNSDPLLVIRKIRDWLFTASRRTTIPPTASITTSYTNFIPRLAIISANLGYATTAEIPFNDFCYIVEEDLITSLP